MGSLPRPCTQVGCEVGVFAQLCLGLGGEQRPQGRSPQEGCCRETTLRRGGEPSIRGPCVLRHPTAKSLCREALSGSGAQEPLTGRRPWTGTVVL